MRTLRQRDPNTRLKILEIGAGSGGTTGAVLRNLQPWAEGIQEYCFTDISRAFLLRAQESFAPKYPFLTTRTWDTVRKCAAA